MDEETAEALTRTKALYDAGVLTEEEYNSKKNELLNPPAVVVAQPPANEHGGVVEGHVVAVQPQKVHPEPRPQEDILANYRSNEEASRAATLIQAEARSRAAWKDYPLPPGATSATSLQGWWLGLGIGCTGIGAAGEGGEGGCCIIVPLGGPWCFKLEAHGHNRLRTTNQCGFPISPDTCCSHGAFYTRERGLFYTDVKLFKKQEESDAVLDDAACMLGCPRSCLNVVAADKGLVVGRLQFREDGDLIDCTRMGVTGKAIPAYIDKITEIRSDAEFVLLVEKDAAYNRLAEDRFYNQFPCILITGKGQPDVATRMFLSRLKQELKIPVLAFVDSDPYGLKILSVYMSGSKAMSYDSASLTTPDIKWLGLRPSDLDAYALPDQCRLPMTQKDIDMGKQLLKEEFVLKNPAWVRELERMLQTKQKAEIQALSAFGFQFVTKVYLPRKLRQGDWI